MKRLLIFVFSVLAIVLFAAFQSPSRADHPLVGPTSSMPATCAAHWDMWIKSDGTSGDRLYLCNAAGNGWENLDTGGAGSALPSGSIIFIASGTCPAGYVEATGLSGRTLDFTLAANGDVGTTGGAARTFVGTALGTHTHSVQPTGSIAAFDNRPAFIKVIGCQKT